MARCHVPKGPAQPSPTLGDALNAGYAYLEVRCLGCDTHQTVALDVVRRPKTTPIHELERYIGAMSVRGCGAMRARGAIWWPCGTARFQRVTRLQHGGRENDDRMDQQWSLRTSAFYPRAEHSLSRCLADYR